MKNFVSTTASTLHSLKKLWFLSVLVVGTFGQTAKADVITTTTTQSYAGSGFVSPSVSTSDLGCCTFNQFDSSLGTLTNVTVQLIGNIFGRQISEFYPLFGTAVFRYALYLDVGGNSFQLDKGQWTLQTTLPDSNSVVRRGFYLQGNANSVYSPEFLSNFIGPGTFDLRVVVDAPIWNGTPLTAQYNAGSYDISGQLMVYWRYDTSTATNSGGSGSGSGGGSSEVPAPGAFLLMSLELLCFAGIRRQHKLYREKTITT